MRKIRVGSLGRNVSVLGFGCASLGSRVGPKPGLLALERAFDAGISWYDVAPPYGDGNAEAILGNFLLSRRSDVQVCTKVGIRSAPTPSYMKMVAPLARTAVNAAPWLRTIVSRVRQKSAKVPLSPTMIHHSIEQSLRRLRTDYVDVLALHEATSEEVLRDDILDALQKVLRDGKALSIGIAADANAALAGIANSTMYSILQLPGNPFDRSLQRIRARSFDARAPTFVTHSVFGVAGALDKLTGTLMSRPEIVKAAREAGYLGGEREIAATVLADFALEWNNSGIVLVSLFRSEHLKLLCSRVDARSPAAMQILDSLGPY